jgi:hypothetical protein
MRGAAGPVGSFLKRCGHDGTRTFRERFSRSRYLSLGRTADGLRSIDPTVFVDDEMVVVTLNDDMVSINGKMREATPQGYFESPYLIKRAGTYSPTSTGPTPRPRAPC